MCDTHVWYCCYFFFLFSLEEKKIVFSLAVSWFVYLFVSELFIILFMLLSSNVVKFNFMLNEVNCPGIHLHTYGVSKWSISYILEVCLRNSIRSLIPECTGTGAYLYTCTLTCTADEKKNKQTQKRGMNKRYCDSCCWRFSFIIWPAVLQSHHMHTHPTITKHFEARQWLRVTKKRAENILFDDVRVCSWNALL